MNDSIQSSGGKARAAALSPERRSEIASQAADTRWSRTERKCDLTIPLEDGRQVRIPSQMSQSDFDLLMETLALWKTKLVVKNDVAHVGAPKPTEGDRP